MECNCYLRHVQHLLADGRTPYERRFGESLQGPIIPFGAIVECHPISAERPVKSPPKLVRKFLPGIFLGCALVAVGLKSDIMVADNEELEI